MLVSQGLLTEEQLQACLAAQSDVPPGARRRRLGTVVVDSGLASERQMAEALAEALGLELVDLGRVIVAPEVARSLPRAVAERSGVLVLERHGNRLVVATADPTNVVALDDAKLYTGASDLRVVVATESQVRDHLARAWSLSEDSSDVSNLFEDAEVEVVEDANTGTLGAETAPIVRLVDAVLADAVRARASDVHIEPQAGEMRVRYRVDGVLRDVMAVPRSAAGALVSRMKIVSGLDIAERRRPQDGRARINVDGVFREARVSTLPALHGEKVVVRLLPRAENVPLVSETGLDERQVETLLSTLASPQGLVLITGPTGSGKTNTLYAAIQEVSTPERNIVTLEDPVEVQVGGITQVQIHERSGLTFAKGLRSVLRQDPDVVLVGEVRDSETAELALQASLTGHLVLTTLHTNDAVTAVTRLVDMGVEPFLVASSLSLVVAQRLVRRPCPSCVVDDVPSARTLTLLGLTSGDIAGGTPKRGRGCGECGGTGFRGRTGIFEVLPVTAALRAVLLTNLSESAIRAAARASGMTTLRASALAAAARGETTYDEVLRVTHVDTVSGPRCPACTRALAEDMVMCPWCATAVDSGHCSGCAKPLEAEWRVCPWCRTPSAPVDMPPLGLAAGPTRPRLLVLSRHDSVADQLNDALGDAVRIEVATSAQEGMTAVAHSHFDGVVVADDLTDVASLDLVRLWRSEPRTGALPLAFLSSTLSEGLAAQARLAGVNDALPRQLDPATLAMRVLALLDRSPVAG